MISCVADAVVVIDSWLCEVWQWWVYKYHVESFIFIIIINYNKIIVLYTGCNNEDIIINYNNWIK